MGRSSKLANSLLTGRPRSFSMMAMALEAEKAGTRSWVGGGGRGAGTRFWVREEDCGVRAGGAGCRPCQKEWINL